MKKIVTLIAALAISAPVMAQNYLHSPPPNGPSEHATLMIDFQWWTPIAHSYNTPIDCESAAADTVSQCLYTFDVPQSEIDAGAEFLAVRLKTKAWIPNGANSGVTNYSLVYGRAYSEVAVMNHFFHVEEWGGGTDSQQERRRVSFTVAVLPIIDGKVRIEIGKEVAGRAMVEVAIYNEGYLYAVP